ncbi:MAG: hypothetical protein J1F67_05010 [Muribaculaceae bacterium]|nr:hypothetical protein [Muribaculaceae bacterium]
MEKGRVNKERGRFIQRTSLGFTGESYLTGTQKQKTFAFLGKYIFPSFLMYLANTSFSSLPLLNLRWGILTPPFCRKNRRFACIAIQQQYKKPGSWITRFVPFSLK